MMIIRKSPNMMSTIGRIPAMAASTRPTSTLKVVPASATSSPMRTTVGSRRISSAMASLMASPKVSSLIAVANSGIDVLVHFAGVGVRAVHREFYGGIHLDDERLLDGIERGAIG